MKRKTLKQLIYLIIFIGVLSGMFILGNSIIVKALIENALMINRGSIDFGMVFPGETLQENFEIIYLDDIPLSYRIIQKIKPLPDAQSPLGYELISNYCQDNPDDLTKCYRNLCPFLEKVSVEAEGDTEDLAFMDWDDSSDIWTIYFQVPAIFGNVSQDHIGGIVSSSGDYGCDLSVEVLDGITEAYEAHVINITAQICDYSEIWTVGYWKNHPDIYSFYLPQKLGDEYISSAAETNEIFNNASSQEITDQLKAQLLAMKLNIIHFDIGKYAVESEGKTLNGITIEADLLLQDFETTREELEEITDLLSYLNNLHQIEYCSNGNQEPEPYCGDSNLDQGEECDDGEDNGIECIPDYGSSCDYCSIECEIIEVQGSFCGDGVLDQGEECDDGNNDDGDGCSTTCLIEEEPENQPPNCIVELQRDGVEINEISIGEFFNVYVGDSTDDRVITGVRFASDDSQDGMPPPDEPGNWSPDVQDSTPQYYDWDTSSGDWDAITKIKRWSFATGGEMEVWVEVMDTSNTTSTCSANISAKDPIEINVTIEGLFGIWMGFTNINSENQYIVNFEILDSEGKPLGTRRYINIFPSTQKISDWSFKLLPSRNVTVDIVFDPLKKEDIDALTDVQIKIAYSNIEKFVEVDFENYTNIVTTDFDMTEDGYHFPNDWEDDPDGKCYGMAATGILYYTKELPLPNSKPNTYTLERHEAQDDIDHYQYSWFNKWSSIWLGYADNKLNKDEYGELKKDLEEKPTIFFMSKLEKEGKTIHAVVAYRIIENKDKNIACILVYDNNYPYPPEDYKNIHLAFPCITYDFNTEELSYINYSKFINREAKKEYWYEIINILSAGELMVYDSKGRITGFVNGELREEIPLSIYDEENTTVTIFSPSDSYRYEVVGTSDGDYGLMITSVEGGEAVTFTAADIPIATDTIHQYAIDWDALSQGEEGVALQIDSDGDGIFEKTVTVDNDLTYDEFILQTETIIDFDPDTLNLGDEGKFVTVYIELPEEYEISQIDISSIMLNDLVPSLITPAEVGDYDEDGIPDLMVKFNRSDVQAILTAGEEVSIILTGKVFYNEDYIDFKGSDIIRVIDP